MNQQTTRSNSTGAAVTLRTGVGLLILTLALLAGRSTASAQTTRPPDTIRAQPVDDGPVTAQRLRFLLDSLRSAAMRDTSGAVRIAPGAIRPSARTPTRNDGTQSRIRITPDTPFRAELMQAESFLNVQKYAEAVALVEPVFARHPDNILIANALKRGLHGLKAHARLRGVLKTQLDLAPDNPKLHEDLADVWLKEGELASAAQAITHLLALPGDPKKLYTDAANVYLRNGRYQLATDIFLEARRALDSPFAFADRLASIYAGWRKYGLAVEEYYRQLRENPKSKVTVERKIEELIRQGEEIDDIRNALETLVTNWPEDPFTHRLNADLLFELDRYADALNAYRTADSLSENSLDNLLLFVAKAVEAKRYDEAQQAVAWYHDSGTRHPREFELVYLHADAYVGLGLHDSAVAVYGRLLEAAPMEELQAEIAGRIADVYFLAGRNDSALVYYRQVVNAKTRARYITAALVGIGECELGRGRLAAADSAYAAALATGPGRDLKERIDYRRAEILFFSEDYDSCTAVLAGLIAANPRGFYVNDAINLSLLIKENREDLGWSLRQFAAARLFTVRRDYDTAAATFHSLVADSANSLADDALLELARLNVARRQWADAKDDYHRLVRRYPESFLTPLALSELGDLYATHLDDAARAVETYRRVLEDFSHTPHAETVRRKLQKMGQP